MEKLFIYTRVSSDIQTEGHSLETQREIGERTAKQNNLEPVVHNEGAASSKYDNLDNRPELAGLVKMIKAGKVKHFYCVTFERFSRNEILTATLKLLFKENDVLIYDQYGQYDLSDYSQEALVGIKGIFGTMDDAKRSADIKRGLHKAIELGKWQGKIVPYGYKRQPKTFGLKGRVLAKPLIIDDTEAVIVKEIFQMNLQSFGAEKIARILNDRGVPTKTGNTVWGAGTINGILNRTLYKGERHYKGKVIRWPIIIEPEFWERVKKNRSKNRNGSSNHRKHFYLLADIIKCGRCDTTMIGFKQKNHHAYFCLSKMKINKQKKFCGMKNINLHKLENLVWITLIDTLTKSQGLRLQLKRNFDSKPKDLPILKKQVNSLKRKIKILQEQEHRLVTKYMKGDVRESIYNQLKGEVEVEINKLQNEYDNLISRIESFKKGESQYKELINYLSKMKKLKNITDDNEKRKLVLNFIKKVQVDYMEKEKEHVVEIEFKIPLEGGIIRQIMGSGRDVNTGKPLNVTELKM